MSLVRLISAAVSPVNGSNVMNCIVNVLSSNGRDMPSANNGKRKTENGKRKTENDFNIHHPPSRIPSI